MKIYVAGALNEHAVGYIKNMHKMIKAADYLRRAGFSVFIPCLDFLSGLVCGDYEYQDYFDNNTPWLLCSDVVYVLPGWESSKGTWKELDIAQKHNIPVRFLIDELMKDLGE